MSPATRRAALMKCWMVAAEEAAEAGRHGIWQGRFDAPWDWRKKN